MSVGLFRLPCVNKISVFCIDATSDQVEVMLYLGTSFYIQ